jgi:hypothetical protein
VRDKSTAPEPLTRDPSSIGEVELVARCVVSPYTAPRSSVAAAAWHSEVASLPLTGERTAVAWAQLIVHAAGGGFDAVDLGKWRCSRCSTSFVVQFNRRCSTRAVHECRRWMQSDERTSERSTVKLRWLEEFGKFAGDIEVARSVEEQRTVSDRCVRRCGVVMLWCCSARVTAFFAPSFHRLVVLVKSSITAPPICCGHVCFCSRTWRISDAVKKKTR